VEKSEMTTIYVAHDQFGQILSVVPEEGDVPVAGSGVQVTEVPISGEMEQLELDEVARRFHVDVRANELVEGPLEPPRQN
jgi:hypothetical protein